MRKLVKILPMGIFFLFEHILHILNTLVVSIL
jgi:hypothetical protein